MKSFTVLLAIPNEIANGNAPHENVYTAMVAEESIEDAVTFAQRRAADAYNYDGNGEDFAVLAVLSS